ncbi:hypothetical protein IAI51_22955 [Pseudomonas sp. N40(2020)]|uniref:hypothetical protein n=1 Tax=Pseudomonas sp. N40(2020) TaxID=2767798 RepID=UPI00165761B9|nr:hypothetical protein [Pseudomonas sp. N40(2020)]MBC8999388.1 hypothetical protein [Pseudomonas sp. N40(2020)]
MPAIKISALFEQITNWQNFAAHFYNYKVCGELPGIFGRDERLDLTDMPVTGPDAHNRSEWGSFLRNVHCQIVEPWTLGRIAFPDLDDL